VNAEPVGFLPILTPHAASVEMVERMRWSTPRAEGQEDDMRSILNVTVCLVVIAGVAAAGEHPAPARDRAVSTWAQVGPMRVPSQGDPQMLKREIESVHAWLMAEQVVEGIERPLLVRLTPRELEQVESGVCEGCEAEPARLEGCEAEPARLLVGITKDLRGGIALDRVGWGSSRPTPDGGRVWSAAVRSEGAFGLRLHFSQFRLPPGTELHLFNDKGEAFGPYVGDGPLGTGDFWSHMVRGHTVYLQLRSFGPTDLRQTSAILVGVGHVGSRFGAAVAGAKAFCDFNAGCIENVTCYDPPEIADARNAVAHMLFVDEPNLYACSGGLINNTENDGTPYFLTANHCLNTDAVAATLETYFQWTVPCGAACPDQWGTPIGVPSVLGATVIQSSPVSDYSLLRLSGTSAPAGTTLLGWTSQPVANDHAVPLFRVSHPAGAPQAYTKHEVDTEAPTCLFLPRGSWIYSRDVLGAIEGGSSGSPVVNSNGQVVGQLTGTCGLFARYPCWRRWHTTVDGAFANYYADVAQWLDPSSVCTDDLDGDGFISVECGGDDCDDGDFLVNPDATEVCDNGIDDERGEPCSSGAQCCSKWCRWLLRICW
jgi:hypothetical protein